MATRRRARAAKGLWHLAASIAAVMVCAAATPRTQVPVKRNDLRGPFYVRSDTGKCLTFGSAAIYMDRCNGSSPGVSFTLPQAVSTQELDRHEVVIRFGDRVLGVGAAVEGVPLQLQSPTYAATQRWAFDGDTLMLAADPSLVLSVQGGRTPRGTAAVLKRRDLADSEFWTFVAVDGSDVKPHSGFVHVSTVAELGSRAYWADWGTVIEVDQQAMLLMDFVPVTVHAGVTIRGDRRATRLGRSSATGPSPSGTASSRSSAITFRSRGSAFTVRRSLRTNTRRPAASPSSTPGSNRRSSTTTSCGAGPTRPFG